MLKVYTLRSWSIIKKGHIEFVLSVKVNFLISKNIYKVAPQVNILNVPLSNEMRWSLYAFLYHIDLINYVLNTAFHQL